MNKPPYFEFKLPCVACSTSQKTQPHAIFEDFIFLSDIPTAPPHSSLCFPPFLLNSGSLKLPDGHFKKMVEIEGLEGGRESTKVSLTAVLHIFFELKRCAEKENTKWKRTEKKKKRFSATLVGDVTVGDELVMLCLSLIC